MEVCPTVLKKICRRGGLPQCCSEYGIAALREMARKTENEEVRTTAEAEIVTLEEQITEIHESSIRERAAIRCARATMLLYKLASSSRDPTATIDSGSEEGETRRENEDLKKKLAMEKKRTNRIKLCGFMEMLLLVVLVLLISTFFLVFFLGSR
ncbi:unnamed protein product [Arabis nemorensis]|uniref:Uncharacterized protein n=1 Tax=Arabis nemorensis TaxID=586526 RepID=A0A565CMC8_9BRAS|nr:unnamed protein product [Arabis nemorensis]